MSDFVQDRWIKLLYGYGPHANGYTQSHRPILSKQFLLLSWLCTVSKQFIDVSSVYFKVSSIINAFTLSKDLFKNEMENIIEQFIRVSSSAYRREMQQTLQLFENAYYINDFNTDWLPEYGDEQNDYVIRNKPRLFAGSNCSCAVSSYCYEPLLVGPPNLTLPGLVIGCSAMRGLRMSTLECFYSSSCISSIVNHFHYHTELNGSVWIHSVNTSDPLYQFKPLDYNSFPSNFYHNTSIGNMVDEFFIDKWIWNMSFERYFNYCAPSFCQYSFVSRQSMFTVVSSVLSFYGGLTIGWRLIIWNGVKLLKKICL